MTVQPDSYPAAVLAPGVATWLTDDPHHAQIEPCDAPVDTEAETGTE